MAKKASGAKVVKPTAIPAQVPDINEVDGEPIFHAPEEEGTDDE